MSPIPDVRPRHVLFICTHNSARSILAEALLNRLGAGRFKAYSAGSQPRGAVQPLALATLERMYTPVEGLRSKDWSEYASAEAPRMDFVITVCDRAAGETCPVWPGQPMTAHWGVADPSQVQGSPQTMERAYWDTALLLRRRIELMLSLPMDALDRMALEREVRTIGQRS